MQYLDVDNWNRKEHFEFFNTFVDPYFAVTQSVDVTEAFAFAKRKEYSFFAVYLYACMKAINSVENFSYRIHEEQKVAIYEKIHASATIMRPDKTFGFSFIEYTDSLKEFLENLAVEKERILNTTELFPPVNSDNCIYCSAMPWSNFSGHKEPFNGTIKESVPKLAFGKTKKENGRLMMPVAVSVNHAVVDGYHVGLFFEKYQTFLQELTG